MAVTLALGLLGGGLLGGGLPNAAAQESATQEYHFALITDGRSDNAVSGASQGLAEANLQGRFLGKRFHLTVYPDAALDAEKIQAIKTDNNPYAALLAALPAAELLRLARAFPNHAVFNLTATDDALRRACHPNLLHTIPGEKMYADARRQWLQKHPRTEARISAWHPDFVKFAARDLNKRYRKAFGRPMDEFAWAGWAAVKMTADHLARGHSAKPKAVLRALKTELAFDGQKGLNMDFRVTGQLRQILLVADASGKLLGEAPVRGVAGGVDSLGRLECE